MKIKLSQLSYGGKYDQPVNIEMAQKDVMAHIEEHGGIDITNYNRACNHYGINRETLFVYTTPYSKWCMDCSQIVTHDNWNESSYRCRPCAVKHDEKMKGFVMVKAYEGSTRLETTNLIHAIKHVSNYEADLYIDGKLVMSCLGLDHEDNKKLLEKYGVVQFSKNKRLAWKYADESLNEDKIYAESYKYSWDGEPKVQVTLRDYRVSKEDGEFDTLEKVKAWITNEWGSTVTEINVTCFLENEHWSIKYTLANGWLEEPYFVVGIFDSFVPPWLCIHADSEDEAIQKYIEKNKNKLFEDEYPRIKVHGRSRTFIEGSLEDWAQQNLSKEILEGIKHEAN